MNGALTAGDPRGALDVVRELHEVGHDPQGWVTGLAGLGRLVGCESIGSARMEASTGRPLTVVADPPEQTVKDMRQRRGERRVRVGHLLRRPRETARTARTTDPHRRPSAR